MRFPLLAALALFAACAGPKPCTRSLCVAKLDGAMELTGWNGKVLATADSPKPPVVSDTLVRMVSGTAELVIGRARVTAGEGASFSFTVSTRAVPSIDVSSGPVSVSLSTGAPIALAPGAYYLPRP